MKTIAINHHDEELILSLARELVISHHSKYDPSHDIQHVYRVVSLSLLIAKSIPSSSSIDLLAVTLSALFHDLLDKKYLPLQSTSATGFTRLESFWSNIDEQGWRVVIGEERRRLIEQIMENVSYSKEVKRLARRRSSDAIDDVWFNTCLELHCVQDADKLDAIGAFGILRCAAYSGASNIALHSGFVVEDDSLSSTAKLPAKSTAIDHFAEKLFSLEGMMKTDMGRTMAKRRTEVMRSFVTQVDNEWDDIEAGGWK